MGLGKMGDYYQITSGKKGLEGSSAIQWQSL